LASVHRLRPDARAFAVRQKYERKSLVVGRYQPWLTAADAYVARYPTKLAFCSRFRRQRETPCCSDFSLWPLVPLERKICAAAATFFSNSVRLKRALTPILYKAQKG